METYVVKFNYQKDDGFWVTGKTEEVSIESDSKNNHSKAAAKIKKKYKNCKVVSVTYV